MKLRLRNDEITSNYAMNLMCARGVEDMNEFLNPNQCHLQDPNAMEGMQVMTYLMQKMIENGTNGDILLVVDSDCDGYTSSAIFYRYMRLQNPSLNIIPIVHEAKQHGLEDIQYRVDLDNYSHVILPDGGTNDGHICEQYPKTVFMVLDHHDAGENFTCPQNMFIVNNQMSPNYINKGLCGAGVVFQACRATDARLGTHYADQFIDLAAVGIVADMMPVNSLENRFIIKHGLANIQNSFLRTLIDKAAFSLGSGPLTPTGIAFYIAPLINSMTRAGTLEEKERMAWAFLDGERMVPCNKRGAKGTMERVDIESARECTNTKSKQTKTQEKMTALAEMRIMNDNLLDNKILIIELDEDFDGIPPEMNGLTAMKLSQRYQRPTLVVRENSEGFLRGSARGLATIDMPPLKEFCMSSGMFEYAEG